MPADVRIIHPLDGGGNRDVSDFLLHFQTVGPSLAPPPRPGVRLCVSQ
jgi:hypothetical protein